MKDIYFYSPIDWFESWDWRNLDDKGVGGSETSHIILSRMLSRRGYNVTSYAPIPDDCPGEHKGVKWLHYKDADTSKPGLWIIYRSPQSVDLFGGKNQEFWVVCQDVDYSTQWNEDRVNKIDKIIALCPEHVNYLKKLHNVIKDVYLSGNGIRSDLVYKLRYSGIKRDPKRLIYSSSPDRGLFELLKIFQRVYEQDKEFSLYCFYGMDHLEKVASTTMKKRIAQIKSLLNQPGVHWEGKVSQEQLYKEFLKSGIWCYPTWFSETSGITCMEAQSLGAIPITRPYWGLIHNVKHGVFIQGNPREDALVCARYVDAILTVGNSDEGIQEDFRRRMMNNSIRNFSWSYICDQWECWINNYGKRIMEQQLFQYKHFDGKVLNVGSGADVYDILSGRDIINLDVCKKHPSLGFDINPDIVADARDLPQNLFGKFDTVVLGDILEHMSKSDGIKVLANAKSCLRNGGRVIITCPEDSRSIERQLEDCPVNVGIREYTSGCSTHHRLIKKEELLGMINDVGLNPFIIQELEYAWFNGWGIVANDRGK